VLEAKLAVAIDEAKARQYRFANNCQMGLSAELLRQGCGRHRATDLRR
jgi:hypothetical protein